MLIRSVGIGDSDSQFDTLVEANKCEMLSVRRKAYRIPVQAIEAAAKATTEGKR